MYFFFNSPSKELRKEHQNIIIQKTDNRIIILESVERLISDHL